MTVNSKICNICKLIKTNLEFYKRNGSKDGLQTCCIKCHNKLNNEVYKRDPKKVRNRDLKRKYGININKYNLMLAKQDNKCAICSQSEIRTIKGTISSLAVDHCHKTGKIRQLLCARCNTVLGHTNDSIDILKRAISYLEKHNNS